MDPTPTPPDTRSAAASRPQGRSSGRATVDELSEASFPASDAPPSWTWEVAAPPTDRASDHEDG